MENAQSLKLRQLMAPPLIHHAAFVVFTLAGALLFSGALMDLGRFSWRSDTYSHILLIPFMSLWLIAMERTAIFGDPVYSFPFGLPVVVVGLALSWIHQHNLVQLSPNDTLALATLAALIFWIGTFITAYGVRAFKHALFPLLMLVFMIPFPDSLYEAIVYALQMGSTEAAYWLFSLTGVPLLRNGVVFSLPGLDLEVAQQCSGIRSGLSLFIVSLVEGHFFLKTLKNKVLLALSAVFIAMLKNGLRIVTLGMLAVYYDRRILEGDLHRKGGIPFFALAFLMLALVLWGLRRMEGKTSKPA